MKRIKVLQITQSWGGGVQKYITQICRNLDPTLFQLTGCCALEPTGEGGEGDIPFPDVFRQMNIPYFLAPMRRKLNPWQDLRSFGILYRQIKAGGFDIVHAHSSKAGVLARVAARLARVPIIIYSPHAFAFDGPGPMLKKLPYLWFEKIAACFGDAFMTDSPSEKALALKFRLARDEKVFVVPTSILLEEYDLTLPEEERGKYFQELGIRPGQRVVIMVGRLTHQKDPLSFIRAAHHLLRFDPDLFFLLVGDGPLLEACLQMVAALELGGKMRVLGWRRDYKALLSLSEVVVCPSLWEGLPFILLEAMALRKPVVAASTTGTVDVLQDGQNGFLVPPQSFPALAEKVRWLLDHPHEADRIGDAAQRTIAVRFNLSQAIARIQETYIQLLQAKRGI